MIRMPTGTHGTRPAIDIDRHVGEFARVRLRLPFVWGQTDCNILVLRWAEDRTGLVLCEGIVGEYGTAEEAALFAEEYPRSLESLLVGIAGFTKVETDFPRAGDVLLVQRGGEPFTRSHVVVGSSHFLSTNAERGHFVDRVTRLEPFTTLRPPSE